MILTPHAIVGASLANMFPNNPVLGFGLAFFSHYVLDALPHIDYNINSFLEKETKTAKPIFKTYKAALHFFSIIFDFIIAMSICALIFINDEKSAFITLLGLIGGVLPDFFQFMYYKFKNEPWIFLYNFHDKVHDVIKIKNKKFWGILLQFLLPVIFLIMYFVIKNKLY